MTKLVKTLSLALALFLVPSYAFAEISLSDGFSDLTALESTLSVDANLLIAHPGGPGPGPRPRPGGPGPGPRPGGPGPGPIHFGPAAILGSVIHHYRPRLVHPVVIVEQPATTVVVENKDEEVEVRPSRHREGSRFGFGVRGVGLTQSSIHLRNGECIETRVNGGAGWYVKFRPIRFVSVEFMNDFIFGGYKNGLSGSYVRVPLSLGLRGHVLNYGSIDVYGAAAASMTFISLRSGYGEDFYNAGFRDTRFMSWGGRFGAGVSFIAGGFEFGFDVRYTIDEAPDISIGGFVDESKRIHGFLFSANFGFAL